MNPIPLDTPYWLRSLLIAHWAAKPRLLSSLRRNLLVGLFLHPVDLASDQTIDAFIDYSHSLFADFVSPFERIQACQLAQDKSLNLRDTDLTVLPYQLYECGWIETLLLGYEFAYYTLLEGIRVDIRLDQTTIYLSSHLSDLPPDIKTLTNLKKLTFHSSEGGNQDVNAIAPVEGFHHLETLQVIRIGV